MKRITKILFYAGVATAMLASCQKEIPHRHVTLLDKPAELSLSIDGVEETIGLIAPKTKAYNIHVTAGSVSDQMLTVTIAPNPDKVAEYNAANNTNYDMVPGDAYEISNKTFLIPRYNTEGTTSTVTLKASGLPDDEKVRVLPITITKVEGEDDFTVKDSTVFITVYRISTSNIRFEKGTGTAADPFLVEVANDMYALNNDLKDGEANYVKLAADIDMSTIEEWMPVNAIDNPKIIHLDGDGHTISNMYSNATVKPGLFGSLIGSVKNINFADCTLDTGKDKTGAGLIAGYAKNATFENITVTGLTINSSGYKADGQLIGGLVGVAEDCIFKNNNINLSVPDKDGDAQTPSVVGGMVGALKGKSNTVENCHTKGSIYGHHYCGGLIGAVAVDNQIISKCTAKVDMTTYGNYCAGFIGYANKGLKVTDCSAESIHISDGQFNYKGGFIGACQGGMTAQRCSFVGEYRNHSGTHIGAFIGNPYRASSDWNDNKPQPGSVFEDCYASGKMTVSAGASNKGRMQGGFIGVIEGGTGISVSRCYSSVDLVVPGANGAIGGLIGVAVMSSSKMAEDIGFSMQDCIAWNAVISNEAPAISGGFSVGAVIGAVAKPSSLSNNYRRSDMKFTEIKSEGSFTLSDQASNADLVLAQPRCPYHGIAAPAGATCSQVAKTLGWSEEVWDLSGEMPKLK